MLQAFVYDAIGNLAKKAEGGTVTRTATNCTGNTVTTLGYDALNQLIRVAKTGLPTEKYVYDDSGRRVRKVVGSTTTNFLYQGPDVYAEYGSSFTTPAALYTHGPGSDDPILRQTGMGPTATAKYYHQDGLGSVVALSTQTGTTAASQRFDAWGNKTASSGTVPQYGYTGREPDATGFVYYRARYYDPSMGRFTQRDPSGFGGGINAYAYVNGNPINFNDPQGLVANWTVETTKSYFNDSPLGQAYNGNYAETPSLPSWAAKELVDPYHQTLENPVARLIVGLFTSGCIDETLGGLAIIYGGVKNINAPKGVSSNSARREVMRQQDIPTSQQPISQSRNMSGRSYEYEVLKPGGGTQIKSVQQQTMDQSHLGQGHWEAGSVKTDPISGQVRSNQYGRPKLTNDKSKVNYDD